MNKKIKLASVLLAGAMAFTGLTGCGTTQNQSNSGSGTKPANKKIGMVLSTQDNPFFVSMKDGAQKKAKELGYDLIVVDSGNDATKERSNVDDLIQKGVGALIINPTDSDAVVNAIKAANDAKIPVITVDRAANGGNVVTHIASDNVKGGEMAANFIVAKLAKKGNIVELQGTPGTSATRDRGKGFHNIVDTTTGIKVVASQSANFDRTKGLDVMTNIIQSTPNFNAVFAQNDEMALGAVKALKSANKKGIIVVGFDGSDDAKAAVKSGDMAATVAQQPDLMGSMAVDNAVKIIKGQTVAKQIPVALQLVTK